MLSAHGDKLNGHFHEGILLGSVDFGERSPLNILGAEMIENHVCFSTNFLCASVRCLEGISDAQGEPMHSSVLFCSVLCREVVASLILYYSDSSDQGMNDSNLVITFYFQQNCL